MITVIMKAKHGLSKLEKKNYLVNPWVSYFKKCKYAKQKLYYDGIIFLTSHKSTKYISWILI